MTTTILVRGVCDVGSAVAHVLNAADYRVAIHDAAAPSCARQGMAFVDAIFDGSTTLAGTLAMGSSIAIDFQPTEGGKATITGDFVLTNVDGKETL